jgi:hypothetical protein
MAAYVIGLGRSAPRGMAWAKEYLPKAGALVAKHAGKALIGGNSTPRLLALEGSPSSFWSSLLSSWLEHGTTTPTMPR